MAARVRAKATRPRSGGVRVTAYVLIETAAGQTKGVRRELARLATAPARVVRLDAITGPWDFIALLEGPTLDAIGNVVTDAIGAIDGVTRTTTCVAVSLG